VTVAVTLLAASYAKLTDFAAGEGAVNRLGGVRERLATPLAYVIPVLELALGIGLIAGAFVRWLAVATTVLLVMFTWVLLSALAHGIREDCACFGRLAGSKMGVAALIRNGVLVVASLIVAMAPTDGFARDVSSTIRTGASDEPWLAGSFLGIRRHSPSPSP